ncbi:hypothetical protein BK120_19140 [Paenibacillus sp. FSL A5-0031]|uniref:hypothetical protein n=1 Tax=Paenibacillus sp. FSL A5-0031 TaxID=1920420 RepID=UPI00096D2459|nr:hypothetical protein [Paenibacillus sp. FSL A5-0031]OME80787.1 hypothetical protein BK120_19140 [Paenibacillus sp. FSL A5-0031]
MSQILQSNLVIKAKLAKKEEKQQIFLAIYLCFLLVLTVYQDFPLVNMIGEIGRSPIILLVPLFVLCEIGLLAKHKRVMHGSMLQKYIFGFILYLCFISIAYLLIQFIQGSYSFGSESLLGKAIKVLIYFVLILLYIRHMQLVFSKITSFKTLYGCFLAIVTLLTVIMILELMSMPNAFTYLHAGSNPYWRVRMLTSESSTTGSIVVVYASILVYLTKYLNSFGKTLTIVYASGFFLFYLFITGSKGFMIISLFTLVVTMIKFLDFRKKKNFVLLISVVLAMYMFITNFSAGLVSSFSNDIENYTSSYTRMGTIIIALITVFHNPLGVGTGAYLMYFDKYVNDSISMMSHFYYNTFGISQINAGELLQYSGSDKNLGVKSGFFQWIMFGGLFAVVFFYLLAKNLIVKVKSSSILFLALVFILFSMLLVSLEIKYEIWLLFAFISLYLGKNDIDQPKRSGVSK